MEKDFKVWAMTFLATIVCIAVYNSFVKGFVPTGVRNIVGLG